MNSPAPQDTASEPGDDGGGTGDWLRNPAVVVASLLLGVVLVGAVVLLATGGGEQAAVPVAAVAANDDSTPPEPVTAAGADSQDDPGSLDDPDSPRNDDSTDEEGEGGSETNTEAGAGPDPNAVVFGGLGAVEVGLVTVSGDPLPVPTGDGDDPALGLVSPVVTAQSLVDGSPVTLDHGIARIVGFFAHWCPHCQAELPEVAQWLGENDLPTGTEFVAISTVIDEGRGNYPPSQWFNEVGLNATVLVDDADLTLMHAFGFQGFPAFVVIDDDGVVVHRTSGNIGGAGFGALWERISQGS